MPTSRASSASSNSIPPGPSEPSSIPSARNATRTGSPVRAAPSATTMLAARIAPTRGACVPSSTTYLRRWESRPPRGTLPAMATRPRTRKIGRLSEIAQVAVRHGFGYFFERHKLTDLLPWTSAGRGRRRTAVGSERGRHLREMLDELGPTFVKFGQLLSTRPDVVPPDIVAELRGLQDDVRPFPFAQVRDVVEDRARPDARAGVRPLRRAADRRGLDRSGAPRNASERRRGRRQGAAPERAAPDRVRPRAALPGGAHDQGARPRARLHRRAASSSTSSRASSARSSTTSSRRVTPTRSGATSPAPSSSSCRRSTGTTPASGCSRSSSSTGSSSPISTSTMTSLEERRELAYQVTETWMEMIFRHGFFHGDPHPANVLVLDGRPDRPRRLRARRQADGRGHGAADARSSSTRRPRTWTRCRAGSPSSASAIRRSARRSSAPSCASSTTATSARAWPRSTRSR